MSSGPNLEPEFEAAVRAGFDRDSSQVFDIGQMVGADWDRFCVVRPYTSPERAQERTGLRWRRFQRSGMEVRDDVSLLVFGSGDRVERSFLVSRRIRLFPGFGLRQLLDRDDARFEARRDPNDPKRLELR